MVTIKTIFKIIESFGLMEEQDYVDNLAKAKENWMEIKIPEKIDVDGKGLDQNGMIIPEYTGLNKLLQWVKIQETKSWIVSVAISVSSIFLIKWVNELLEPANPIDEFRSGMNKH